MVLDGSVTLAAGFIALRGPWPCAPRLHRADH